MFPEVGSHVFVRTLTDHWVGRFESADALFVKLSSASWVANTGCLGEFCRTGRSAKMEIEFVGNLLVRYEMILDWPFPLFTEDVWPEENGECPRGMRDRIRSRLPWSGSRPW